ncbi:hypothetical protein AB0J86_30050 [Micromonospora sp. NPDC049559]|uniref:hypothetical protein n=1 Tax=Micromonospora sp. NPDC049559 TaxID=3155923 RepID=UPI003439B794
MFKHLEGLGTRLLERFVPRIEAAAVTCYRGCWDSCWQCDYDPCCGTTCTDGSYHLACNVL